MRCFLNEPPPSLIIAQVAVDISHVELNVADSILPSSGAPYLQGGLAGLQRSFIFPSPKLHRGDIGQTFRLAVFGAGPPPNL